MRILYSVVLKIHTKERFDLLDHETQHLLSQTGIHTDPKRVIHDLVGIGELTADAISAAFKVRLTDVSYYFPTN